MKLSEAILKGCIDTEQIKGWHSEPVRRMRVIDNSLSYQSAEEACHTDVDVELVFEGVCALGAALTTVMGVTDVINTVNKVRKVKELFPITKKTLSDFPDSPEMMEVLSSITYPSYSHNYLSIGESIIILNDKAGWSRERIAHWISKLERYEQEENLINAENKANKIIDTNNKKLKENKEEQYVLKS